MQQLADGLGFSAVPMPFIRVWVRRQKAQHWWDWTLPRSRDFVPDFLSPEDFALAGVASTEFLKSYSIMRTLQVRDSPTPPLLCTL